MALSQIGATTARSQMYLTEASALKSRLFTSTPLLSTKFEETVEKFQLLVKQKTDLLDILCANWTECISEIVNLGIEESALKHKGEENNIQKADSDSLQGGQMQRSGDTKDDEEFDHLLRDIKAVNKVWTKKMEDSEKVRTLLLLIREIIYERCLTFSQPLVENRRRSSQTAKTCRNCASLGKYLICPGS